MITPINPEGLKQSPLKPFTDRPQKVEVPKAPPISVNVNPIDTIRLWFWKKVENTAFAQFQQSIDKTVGTSGIAIGVGIFASINWPALLTGNVFEIIKLVICVGSLVLGWFWKR